MSLRSKLLFSIGLLGVLWVMQPSTAHANSFVAAGEGWCSSYDFCNNTNTAFTSNTFAGSTSGGFYADWFTFNLPNLGAPITSATLSIWNDGEDYTQNPSAVYNVYGASGFSFGGLTTGPSLGSDPLITADSGPGHFENIAINGAGLGLLNANQGGQVFLGGGVTGADTSHEVQIFGYTGGFPEATLSVTDVPEPSTLFLFGAGLCGIAVILRRRVSRILPDVAAN